MMISKKPGDLKIINRKCILDTVRMAGKTTVAEVAAATGLSRIIVMRAVRYYEDKGLVVSCGKGSSSGEGGKRPELFRFGAEYGHVAVSCIAPGSIISAVTDISGKLLARESCAIADNLDCLSVATLICRTINKLCASLGLRDDRLIGIAVGTHGVTDIDRGVVCFSPHFPSWGRNAELGEMIRSRMKHAGPVYMDNQIRFQVYEEKKRGAAQKYDNVVVISGGKGLVAGVMIGGEVVRGKHYLVGEIGHIVLDPSESRACHCGNHGCFETKVEAATVLEQVMAKLPRHPESLLAAKAAGTLRLPDIFDAANRGDALARETMDDAAAWFARGIVNVALMYDPEIVVLQGIYAGAGDYFLHTLRQQLSQGLFTNLREIPRVVYSTLAAEQYLLGGADYAINARFSQPEPF